MNILRIALLVLLGFGLCVPANAQTEERFTALVQSGVSAYKAGQFKAAVDAFREAYKIRPDPTLLFNIGRSLERQGAIDDAINHYKAYVDAPGTTAEGRTAALEKIEALTKEKKIREKLKTNGSNAPPLPKLSSERKEPTKVAPAPPPPQAKTPMDLVALVHASNTERALSFDDLRDIYLGRRKVWGNGARIKAYARPRTTKAGIQFFKKIDGLSAAQYARHWQRLQLAGSGMAPASISAVSGMLKAITTNKGGIGYLLRRELPKKLPPQVRIIVPRKSKNSGE